MKAWIARTTTIGHKNDRITDLDGCVQDLIFGIKRARIGWMRFRFILEPHQHVHLGVKSCAVKLNRFVTPTVEIQIGLDMHCLSFGRIIADLRSCLRCSSRSFGHRKSFRLRKSIGQSCSRQLRRFLNSLASASPATQSREEFEPRKTR